MSEIDRLEAFHDGRIPAAAYAAAGAADRAAREAQIRHWHCRIGRVVDRRPVPQRMAVVMAREYRLKLACTRDDLIAAGFSADDISAHAPVARGLAARMVVRRHGAGPAACGCTP